jgi:hypothetical protein
MEASREDFYDALIDVILQDSYKMGLQIAAEMKEAGDTCTLERQRCCELFSLEWLHARLPWLAWKARHFSDKTIGRELSTLLDQLDREMRELLIPYHDKVPFGIDHYLLNIDAYERGEKLGPLRLSAGPGMGILECYKQALKVYDPDAPEIEPQESFVIIAAGDSLCWTLDTDNWETAVRTGLTIAANGASTMTS